MRAPGIRILTQFIDQYLLALSKLNLCFAEISLFVESVTVYLFTTKLGFKLLWMPIK